MGSKRFTHICQNVNTFFNFAAIGKDLNFYFRKFYNSNFTFHQHIHILGILEVNHNKKNHIKNIYQTYIITQIP